MWSATTLLTLTERLTKCNSLLHIGLVAEGSAAVANTKAEVLVVAEALGVVGRATKLTSFTQHVGDTGLLCVKPVSREHANSTRIAPRAAKVIKAGKNLHHIVGAG